MASILLIRILIIAVLFQGCSLSYIVKAGWTESGILMRRTPIEVALKDPMLTSQQKDALKWVSAAHTFALRRKLDCSGSFVSYSPLDREALSWVLAGAKPFELIPKEWWFPIIGHVPYQGFFEKSDALAAADKLEKEGYQTIVRPVTAFSTLGWFNDPVLTPLLRRAPLEIVNTIIHECVHSTMWVPNNVPFNESIAHFVALNEAALFFEADFCPANVSVKKNCAQYAQEARSILAREIQYAQALSLLKNRLEGIFKNKHLNPAEMKQEKRNAYISALSPILAEKNHIGDNNSALLQELAYHQHFECFIPLRNRYADSLLPVLMTHLKDCSTF